jgi:uncharacterized surface protein with fasciclin (FAS1) repeats
MKRNLTIIALTFFIVSSLALAEVTIKTPRFFGPERNPSIVDLVLNINNATATEENPGQFSILIAALQVADPAVSELLSGKNWGYLTLFAPTDAAFVGLLGELGLSAEELLAQPELVTEVLKYHVVAGTNYAFRVVKSTRLQTLNGESIFQEGGVLTDVSMREANIIAVDIPTVNGVIHVIDKVILPIDIR